MVRLANFCLFSNSRKEKKKWEGYKNKIFFCKSVKKQTKTKPKVLKQILENFKSVLKFNKKLKIGKLTNLIILISIQLLVDVVISLKNTGAKGR